MKFLTTFLLSSLSPFRIMNYTTTEATGNPMAQIPTHWFYIHGLYESCHVPSHALGVASHTQNLPQEYQMIGKESYQQSHFGRNISLYPPCAVTDLAEPLFGTLPRQSLVKSWYSLWGYDIFSVSVCLARCSIHLMVGFRVVQVASKYICCTNLTRTTSNSKLQVPFRSGSSKWQLACVSAHGKEKVCEKMVCASVVWCLYLCLYSLNSGLGIIGLGCLSPSQ